MKKLLTLISFLISLSCFSQNIKYNPSGRTISNTDNPAWIDDINAIKTIDSFKIRNNPVNPTARGTIAQLRATSGVYDNYISTEIGKDGTFVVDTADHTTSDNGTTIIVTSDGKRLKRVFPPWSFNFSWSSPSANGVNDDTNVLLSAISTMADSSVLELTPGKTYKFSGNNNISKYIIIKMNGATLKAAPLSNTSITFVKGGEIYGGTLDNVWIGFTGVESKNGVVKGCTFINQTFANTTALRGASNIDISQNVFKGMARGVDGTSYYPAFQAVIGATNIQFHNNYCQNVVGGVTADGITTPVRGIHVFDNTFDTTLEYAAKFTVFNDASFTHNTVLHGGAYGVFYDPADSTGSELNRQVGNGLDISHNTFKDFGSNTTSACLYVGGVDNPFALYDFNYNTIDNVKYGVLRGSGNLNISWNKFTNGIALFSYGNPYSGYGYSGNGKITNNTIDSTVSVDSVIYDFDGNKIEGAIILSTTASSIFASNWINNIVVEQNTIKNYKTNAIMVARVSTVMSKFKLDNNYLQTGTNSINGITVGGAGYLSVFKNTVTGSLSGVPLNIPSPLQVINTDNIIKENNWQKVTAMPTTGTHVKSEFYENINQTALTANSKYSYAIRGWQRITNGSANVINVDWLPVYSVDPNTIDEIHNNGTTTAQVASINLNGSITMVSSSANKLAIGLTQAQAVTRLSVYDQSNSYSAFFTAGSSGNGVALGAVSNIPAMQAYTSAVATQDILLQPGGKAIGVGKSTNPDASSIMDIVSTAKGVLISRMTAANKNAISSPATGLLIYQTDSTGGFYVRTSTGLWKRLVEERVTAPTVTLGSNITGSVALSAGSTDSKGTVTVTVTGISTLATLNELFTLTFSSAFASAPTVVYSNASSQSAALEFGATGLYVKNAGTTSFQIATNGSYTTPASATYSFNYQIQ